MTSLTMAQVLVEEAIAVHGDRPGSDRAGLDDLKADLDAKTITPDSVAEYEEIGRVYAELQKHDSVALCLSGGGIRSATFALGVLEALARHDLLKEFHYLSTVSGGGYIGSWLSAWIKRAGRQAVFDALARPRHPLPDREPEPMHALRADSNYLTPKLGLMSADTWTGAALYLRNLLMNWAVIGAFVLALVILPRLVAALLGEIGQGSGAGPWLAGLAALLVVEAWRVASANRPTWERANIARSAFLWRDLAPFFVASLAWVFALRAGAIDPGGWWILCPYLTPHTNFFFDLALAGAALALVGWLVGARPWTAPGSGEGCWRRIGDAAAVAVAGAIFGAFVAWGSLLHWRFSHRHVELVTIFSLILGPLWILHAQVIGEAFLVGLRSAAQRGTDDREWLARSAGWYSAASIGWMAASAVVLLGPAVAAALATEYIPHLLTAVGGISGLVTMLLGKSSGTSFRATSKLLRPNIVLAIAAPIFALCLVIGLSALAARILYGAHEPMALATAFRGSTWGWALFWCLALAVVGGITSYFVNVNRFSLHSVYRNRLIRAYLGASNPARHRDPPGPSLNRFTGFDRDDNLSMSMLAAPVADAAHRAFLHVIGICLNVVSTRNLAWQERKAEPFTATALHCGSDRVGFRPTRHYARNLSLGTAMAISGAAASPNMGYHSSPALTLLLALFNVRLGWWLGNPGPEGKKTYRNDGPKLGAWWLAQEALGLTTDSRPYVYLSDGGHFENLGLYEMVRRRCRYMVVSDGGCDPDFEFADLGNAVRKIRIDLGIPIEFAQLRMLRKRGEAQPDGPYSVVGVATYPEIDPATGRNYLGYILYVKPSLHETEPADVRSYAAASDKFPHESTADQWFSESQFESYRALGSHIMETAITDPAVQHLLAQPAAAGAGPARPRLHHVVMGLRTKLQQALPPQR